MEITRPASLSEALDARDQDPGADLLAGGTDLMVEVNFGQAKPEHVIALRRITELAAIEGNRIGAGATWASLERSPHRALAQLARTVGSPQIRAAGTLGGNIGTSSPAGDGLPWLAAVEAEIEVASKKRGARRLRWDEFFTGVKRNALEPDEVIVGVVLPDDVPANQHFAKIGQRSAMVISTVSACVVRSDDGAVRVALGSVAPTPVRARRAEALIAENPAPSQTVLDEFARTVSAEVSPITDHRSTESYRRHGAGVLARRLLERCLAT